ncbi:MAG: ATP phosphoribosyltransferase regulatory subunit [Thiotrichaceae bacterium]
MSDNHYWLLPEGISEALPDAASQLETLRRQLLDLYTGWGYQLVMPPLVEFMDSLSTGTGEQLDLQTFKLTDQTSGRLMGVRADITPQVARIDAHRMRVEHPNRLCYMGPVLRTRSNHANGGSRSPLQIGAELFGHAGIDSDFEVISLAIETLQHCTQNVQGSGSKVILDLGHVGIFSELSSALGLNEAEQEKLSDMLERKSIPDISDWIMEKGFSADHANILQRLPELNGSIEVLEEANDLFSGLGDNIKEILSYLRDLVERLEQNFPSVDINIDCGELRGYAYHTGMMFQLYLPTLQREVIRGGRYDGIGEAFGNARPATGFSADLRLLNSITSLATIVKDKIFAPAVIDIELDRVVKELRNEGHVVVRQLEQGGKNKNTTPQDLGCNQEIVNSDGHWVVSKIDN